MRVEVYWQDSSCLLTGYLVVDEPLVLVPRLLVEGDAVVSQPFAKSFGEWLCPALLHGVALCVVAVWHPDGREGFAVPHAELVEMVGLVPHDLPCQPYGYLAAECEEHVLKWGPVPVSQEVSDESFYSVSPVVVPCAYSGCLHHPEVVAHTIYEFYCEVVAAFQLQSL